MTKYGKNLQIFASSYGSRCFAACDRSTQTSGQVMQRGEIVTADSVALDCVKTSMSESVARFSQIWKIHC